VGRRNVEETGTAWSRIWRPSGEPFAGRSLRQIDMGYQYHSAAVTQDDSPDADLAGADYVPSAAPGCRAPHLWIAMQRGRLSTIDLFDRDFVLLTAEGPVFRGKRGPYTDRGIRNLVSVLGRRADVAHVHPHRFRHDTARRLVEAVDLPTVAALLGHSRLDTISIYAQPDEAALRRAAESLEKA
jgi:hypothetical protein